MQEPQSETELTPGRPEPRRFVAMHSSSRRPSRWRWGCMLRQPSMMAANDISRWCTVWSLLERGTYVIDECPWQIDTQDKVFAQSRRVGLAPPMVKSITIRASPHCSRR